MDKKYKVSVIIPAYNAQSTIANSIQCLLNQKLEGIEIIVIDDGSNDNTLEVVKKFENEDFVIISKNNGGVSTARNKGIDVATGEYLVFLDADDYYDEDAISKMYELAQNYKLDIVVCGHTESNATLYGGNNQTFSDFLALNTEEIGKHYMDLFPKSCIAKLFRADIIQKQNIRFDEGMSLGEDLYFTWSVLPYVSRAGGIGSVFYRIKNINPVSLSKKYVVGIDEDLITLYEGWNNISNILPEAKNVYYKDNMDYGLSIVGKFVNNLFRIGCPHNVVQKKKQIQVFLKKNRFLYDDARRPERMPKNIFDNIQYIVLMSKNANLICIFYWFKEKIKRKKFERGLKNG